MPAFTLSQIRAIANDLGNNRGDADFNEVNRLLWAMEVVRRGIIVRSIIVRSIAIPVPEPDTIVEPATSSRLRSIIDKMLETLGHNQMEISICDATGHLFPTGYGSLMADGTTVGPRYWDHACARCDNCNEGFLTDDLYDADTDDSQEQICRVCADNSYTYCEGHGRFHDDNYVDQCDYLRPPEETDEDPDLDPNEGLEEDERSAPRLALVTDREAQIHARRRSSPFLYADVKLYSREEWSLSAEVPSDHTRLIQSYSTNVLHCRTGFLSAPNERLPSDPLWLGVELEVEPKRDNPSPGNRYGGFKSPNHIGLAHNTTRHFAILKADGSLGAGGFEIVSVPATYAWHRTGWDAFFKDAAPSLTAWSTGRCGIHFHIARHALSTFTIGKASVFLNSQENRRFIEAVAGRSANTYCAYYPKKVTDARIGLHMRNERDHHEALSVSNRNNAETLELRIFRGNVSRKGFMRALDFTVAMFEFAAEASASDLSVKAFTAWFVQPTNRSRFPFFAKWAKKHGHVTYVGNLQPDDEAEAA